MAAVALLHTAPGVLHRTVVVAVAAVEQGTELHHIDLAVLAGPHRDIVAGVEMRARRMTAVGDMGKVHHMTDEEDIDPEGVCHKVVDVKEDLEGERHMAADVVAGNLGVADSSPETDHNPEAAQEEQHVVADTLATGIDLVGAADSLAEESLGDCEH